MGLAKIAKKRAEREAEAKRVKKDFMETRVRRQFDVEKSKAMLDMDEQIRIRKEREEEEAAVISKQNKITQIMSNKTTNFIVLFSFISILHSFFNFVFEGGCKTCQVC